MNRDGFARPHFRGNRRVEAFGVGLLGVVEKVLPCYLTFDHA
jgi:hypothetical protein